MILERTVAVALLTLTVFYTAAGQSKKEQLQTLLTINTRPVSTDEFVYLYRKNHQHKPEEFTVDKIEEYFELFVNYKLKVAEAFARGMDTTVAFRKEYQTYRDELLKPFLPDAHVVDSLVRLTYERLKEEVHASHILISLKPDAPPEDTLKAWRTLSALRQRALAGEDFSALAAAYSEEPGAKNTRGDLGFFTAMQMVYPFEQAAYLTPVGGVSEPIRTRFGYHIVKVHGRRPSTGEVEVSHIMIRTGDGQQGEMARNTVFDIHDKLQKGMNWEELCRQYSEDLNTRDTGGKLRPFGVGGMASVPAFQEMAFALRHPGDISDPFQTQFGWHILRLESKIPLPSFEELKASLTQRVSRDERVQISRNALREKMREQMGYEENLPVKAALAAMPADALLGKEPPPSLDELRGEVLFLFQKKSYHVSDFLNYVRSNGSGDSRSVDQLLSRYVDAVLFQSLEEKVREESPDYKWLLQEYYEGILLFEIMEKEVWNKAMEDTVGQKKYFEEHRAEYTAGERMEGKIYSSPSKEYLWNLKELIGRPDSTVRAFTSRNGIREESGIFERTDRPLLSDVTWAPGSWLTSSKGTHYLVVIDRIVPPGPQRLEEARASVISDYQQWLEESWIAALRRKFRVIIEKKAKKQAFKQLMEDKEV